MLTLALVVAFSAIILFFAKEFGDLFKKIFAIPGAKLFLPLIGVTLLLTLYEPWVYFALFYMKKVLHDFISFVVSLLPFRKGAISLVSIVLFMALALLPAYAMNVWRIHKTNLPFPHSKFLSAMLWLFTVILVTVGFY
jgi:hypothetical protein